MTTATQAKRALPRVRKNFGSMPYVRKVFWVDHTSGTAGCLFRGEDTREHCESVSLDELRGEYPDGRYMTDGELAKYLERQATEVIRHPA